MIKRKYTKELLEPLVAKNLTISGVIRDLGILTIAGGTHAHLTKQIKKLGLDTSHFLGAKFNSGSRHIGGSERKTPKEILVYDRLNGRKEEAAKIRRALIEVGRKELCVRCGLSTYYNGQFLRLQVHHVNGNPLDNREDNLEFICPNCHSQTDNFCTSNVRRVAGMQTQRP